jgi:hypothetical protein
VPDVASDVKTRFIASLQKWAAGVRSYIFNTSRDTHTSPAFAPERKPQILDLMKQIGYELSDVKSEDGLFYAQETNKRANNDLPLLSQKQMSQGMFRALLLVVQLVNGEAAGGATTLLIDDLAEGLDFDRAERAIALLMDFVKRTDAQLVLSTNDRYVMNKVPLECWQVIQRDGGKCDAFNVHNSKDKFEDFQFTGLSNFDFLRSDFLSSQWSEE